MMNPMMKKMGMGMDDDDSQESDDSKMQIIQQLMEELQEMMKPSTDDLSERLGKPKVEVLKMQSSDDEPMDGDDLAMDGDLEDPEEKLKSRLMKLRG